MRLVDDDDGQAGSLVQLPGQQGRGLRSQRSQRSQRSGVERVHGAQGSNGFPSAALPGDRPHAAFGNAPADAGDRLAGPVVLGQRLRRDGPTKGKPGETEMRLQSGDRAYRMAPAFCSAFRLGSAKLIGATVSESQFRVATISR